MLARFMLAGISLAVQTALRRRFIILAIALPPYLSISAVIVSGPGVFLFGSAFISALISAWDILVFSWQVRWMGGPSYSLDQYYWKRLTARSSKK